MPISTNFNVNPYYDDFDEDKKFLRLLYKPGYAVQARELTQLQTILQKQIERFGNHVFKSGSVVSGGQIICQNVTYMNLQSEYATIDIVPSDFDNKTILSNDNTKRGQVIKVVPATETTPTTLLVKQIYGDPFVSSETDIKTVEGGGDAFANRANVAASGVGTGQTFSVSEGVFYYEGFFVKVDAQTVATSVYDQLSNCRVGFEVTEDIVESVDDTSLLDPAQGASNFQAPGSDRFKLTLTLTTRSLDNTDTDKFIQLAEIKGGVLQTLSQTPLYSEIEKTLARRTYDESGDYVVDPFLVTLETSSSNTANMDITLSPGKAYVKGYEYRSIAPVTITIPKPRDTVNVDIKRVSADYGSFVYGTNLYGLIPVDTVGTVDLHCVQNNSISVSSVALYNNTKIGTAKVKAISFDTSTDQTDANTYIYKTFLTDINVGSLTSNVGGSGGNTTTFTLGSNFSAVDGAYVGSKIRIIAGPGSSDSTRTITTYSGSTKNVTVDLAFSRAILANSVYSIDFEFKDTESIVEKASGTTDIVSSINIHPFSKDSASVYQDVYITERELEPLLFKVGENYVVQNSIANFSYEYQKYITGVGFSSGVVDLGPYLSSGETLSTTSSSSTTTKQENFVIHVTNAGTSSYTKNQIVRANSISVSGTDLTVSGGGNMVADILVAVTTTASSKDKVFANANVTIQSVGSANDIFGNAAVYVINHEGQTQIHNVGLVNKIPGIPQSLYVSDVVSINAIFDFQGTSINPANLGAAANVTSRYDLDNGQRDSYYDHAAIVLRAGQTPPVGPLLIRYDRYLTSNTPGYFTVDSYLRGHNNEEGFVTYENIPVFFPTAGRRTVISLKDYFDFRPTRLDASADNKSLANTKVFTSLNGLRIPLNGSDITFSHKNYLPRIDRVVLNTARQFEILQGTSTINPVLPQIKEDSMVLYNLYYPPFVDDTRQVRVEYIRNQRYTMKDIGVLERRLENLEYYTSLSFLEFDTINKQDFSILDSANLPRFKNGIIVDSFNGTSVSNVLNTDFKASIDRTEKTLRPTFNISSHLLTWNPTDGDNTNINRKGPIFTVDVVNEPSYVSQEFASKSVNINPFNFINFLGKIALDPQSDVWYDETRQGTLTVDISGDRAAWQLLVEGAAQTEWNNWQTNWTSEERERITGSETAWRNTGEREIVIDEQGQAQATGRIGQARNFTEFVTTTEYQSRTGIRSTTTLETITRSLGDRVVDVSIIPYMRPANILFVGTSFQPSTQMWPFFDNTPIEQYVGRANKFVLRTNNLQYRTEIGFAERVTIKNNLTNTTNGTALIVHTSNNTAHVLNLDVPSSMQFTGGATLSIIGDSTNQNNVVQYFEHYTSRATAASASTLTLGLGAIGAQNTTNEQLTGQPIKIVSGPGVGQSRTITGYNPATRVATVTPNWETTPDATSTYTIGRLTTTEEGSVAGLFFLPGSIFRVGEKLFRLVDNNSGNIDGSKTNGDATFFASGLLLSRQESQIVATVPSGIQRTNVNDSRTVTSSSVDIRYESRFVYADPLAQTFLVGDAFYPNGLFITKVRVCFKTKDPVVPVTLQVRSTVNGYPSSFEVYPFGTVTLTPDKINVSTTPDLDDPAKYTDFVFDAPIYLRPGEHSFVFIANSNAYEIYAAEVGKTNLRDNKQISDQPYLGSLFLSQNGTTWEPEQNSDMMFRIYRNQYSTTPSQIVFDVNADTANGGISSNVVYDLVHLMSGEVVLPRTSVTYKFSSERAGPTGGLVSYKPIEPLRNYVVDDGEGRRVLNPTTGNNTFKLMATLATSDSAVSPFIDISRFNILTVENRISNLPLTNNLIVIANTGSGMTDGIYNLELSNTGGIGATITANVVSGSISRAWISSGGTNYAESPTINLFNSVAISAGGYNGPMCVGLNANGASILINGETSKFGGPAEARYIMRTVTLADGFDSGDLRVYLTAYKPPGSEIYVYFKPLSVSDPDKITDKDWQLLTQINYGNFVSTNRNDFRELVYAPGINGTANNSMSYSRGSTTFSNFKTFAIKIVMAGTDTVNVPRIKDLRAIALPEGS